MMRKGFTLIEVAASLAIFIIIAFIALDQYKFYSNVYKKTYDTFDESSNVKFAMNFIETKIRNAGSITLSGADIKIDGKRLYISNDILRYDTNSQQVADGIKGVSIKNVGGSENLYEVDITTKSNCYKELVYKRRD